MKIATFNIKSDVAAPFVAPNGTTHAVSKWGERAETMLSFWLTLALRLHTMFHRPSKNRFGVLFQLEFLEGRPSLVTIGPS